MAANSFIMEYYRTLSRGTVFNVYISEGDTDFKTDVYQEDLEFAFRENIDAFDAMIKEILTDRAYNLNDEGTVTDEDYAAFEKILEMIL